MNKLVSLVAIVIMLLIGCTSSNQTVPATSPAATKEITLSQEERQSSALQKAKELLKKEPLSYKETVERLEDDGIAPEDAKYAADSCEADWVDNAQARLKEYEWLPLSHDAQVRQLIHHGFTEGEAEAAVVLAEIDADVEKELEKMELNAEESTSSGSIFGSDNIDKNSAIEITAKQAYQEIEDNQVACKTKYDGKVVAITGTVDSVGTNVLGQEYVSFDVGDPYSLTFVQCFFKNDQMDYVASIQKGQTITLYGYAEIGSRSFKLSNSQP